MASEQPPVLPPREPRPLIVHFLVDSAVAFLAILVLGLIWGIGWGVLLLIAFVIGAIVCPFSRRAEERQLATRLPAPEPEPPT